MTNRTGARPTLPDEGVALRMCEQPNPAELPGHPWSWRWTLPPVGTMGGYVVWPWHRAGVAAAELHDSRGLTMDLWRPEDVETTLPAQLGGQGPGCLWLPLSPHLAARSETARYELRVTFTEPVSRCDLGVVVVGP